MSRAVQWSKRAARRLDQIGARISKDSPAAAAQVVARLAAAAGALGEYPSMGRAGRLEGTREMVLADIPYLIAYRVLPDRGHILTIMHAARERPDESGSGFVS